MKKSFIFLLISTACITLHAADENVSPVMKKGRALRAARDGYYDTFAKIPYTYYDDLAVLSGISLASYGGCMALWKYGRSPHENPIEEARRHTAYKKITACLSLSLGSLGSFLYSMHKTFRYTAGIDADCLHYRRYPEFEGDTEICAKLSYIVGIGAPLCVSAYLLYKEIRERKKASAKLEVA